MRSLLRFLRKWLNALGLILGIVGVAMVWHWGLPQPSFERGVALGIDGPMVEARNAEVQALEAHFRRMSHVGFGLILAGFACQLLNETLPASRTMTKPVLSGDALMSRAEHLGVSTASGDSIGVAGKGMVPIRADEHEIQRRVLEAERHVRDGRLWIVALVSAIASLISAAAAWVAIFFHP